MKLQRIFWLTVLVHAAFASMRVTVSLFMMPAFWMMAVLLAAGSWYAGRHQ